MKITLTMKTICNIINDNTDQTIYACVERCYMDMGAGIWWDTIIIRDLETGEGYQALSPYQHNMIELGYFTLDDVQILIDTAEKIFK